MILVSQMTHVFDYRQSWTKLISDGCYDDVDPRIKPKHFGVKRQKAREVRLVLGALEEHEDLDSCQIEKWFQSHKCRVGTTHELLLFGALHESILKSTTDPWEPQQCVIALGSMWEEPFEDETREVGFDFQEWVVGIETGSCPKERKLELFDWRCSVWFGDFFLGVREDT